jgi:hypothetical protein
LAKRIRSRPTGMGQRYGILDESALDKFLHASASIIKKNACFEKISAIGAGGGI